jgi:hypothetical protein
MIPHSELRDQLVGYLKELRLPTIRDCFEDIALKAEQESLGYEHYLLEVTGRGCEVRQQKRIAALLHKSQLPLEKSLTELDLNRLPRKVVNQIQTLLVKIRLDHLFLAFTTIEHLVGQAKKIDTKPVIH